MISFLSVFPPYRGGIAKFSDYLYRSLSKKTDVRAYNFRKLYPDLLFPGKSQTISNQRARYALPLLHSMNPFNWNISAEKIAERKPEALIYSYWHPFFSPSLLFTIKKIKKKVPGIQVVGIAHNVIPHEYFPFQSQLSSNLFDETDHVILLSEQTKSEYKSFKNDNKAVRLFHPVYNQPIPAENKAAMRNRYGLNSDSTIFLFFGLIRQYKGLDIMIQALNTLDLHRHNIQPLIVGEFYTDKQKLLSLINPDHLSKYKIIDRFVSEQEAAELLTLSDAMILPYRSASQSGVLSNAINFKLPVIVSDLPGLKEHITPNKNGIVFKQNSVEDLRKAILLMANNNLAAKMSTHMKELKNRLTWEKFSDEILEIIT